MNKSELEKYFASVELEKYTETTLIDRNSLLRNIKQVKKYGYAVANREEFWQVVGIAAPIVDYDNRIMAALSLWTPVRFASLEELKHKAPLLLEVAIKISACFGSMA